MDEKILKKIRKHKISLMQDPESDAVVVFSKDKPLGPAEKILNKEGYKFVKAFSLAGLSAARFEK